LAVRLERRGRQERNAEKRRNRKTGQKKGNNWGTQIPGLFVLPAGGIKIAPILDWVLGHIFIRGLHSKFRFPGPLGLFSKGLGTAQKTTRFAKTNWVSGLLVFLPPSGNTLSTFWGCSNTRKKNLGDHYLLQVKGTKQNKDSFH